ncbi:N-acetyllactosaminide beta-1,6-N-acetylglucosaminyl-transferase-like isoform X2 [Pristis pectinata]|uniref:N-acetyllactosaminide beta-1,6-N-acetylglucosaminyl-transferase-like isoform X2 n=1 Tax=Pristis pectinata TaxID=685728 RepID=UPI00223E3655|nr:N-acetyllactosaminide beta-1,6-N-acetylglucosaminyl-transferase-like isoform X2 [Pristis pectinata]
MNPAKLSVLFCAAVSAFVCLCIYLLSKAKKPVARGWSFDCARCGDYPDELCSALFDGKAVAAVLGAQCEQVHRERPGFGAGLPVNCSRLLADHSYITKPLSQEEADFPLAYILVVHKNLQTLEWLFRAIYMPQNVYCIHVDQKAPAGFRQAVEGLAACFDNVFLASRTESVVYGGFSRLQADLNCMQDLVLSSVPWKYALNLCGQDYPLKSNRELVQLLKQRWKDKNITPGILQPDHIKQRTTHVHREYISPAESYVVKTETRKAGGVPHGLKLYFGSAYYAVTREFVDFVLKDERAKDLLQWSRDTYSPDEHYWVTLNRISDAPGADPSAEWEGSVRSIKWLDQATVAHNGCKGHYVRNICVYGLGDLEWLVQRDSLFANKFEVDNRPLVAQCMERWLRRKTLSQSEVPIPQEWHIKNNKCFFDIEGNDCSTTSM